MEEPQDKPQYPKDKEELLRELTLADRLKDIRDQERLRERLAPRWWETLLPVVQFAAALGLLASLMQLTSLRSNMFVWLTFFWGALTIVSLVMGFEFVIFRLQAMRRANEILVRQIEELGERVGELEKDRRHSEKDGQ